jgi:hypothetical protein
MDKHLENFQKELRNTLRQASSELKQAWTDTERNDPEEVTKVIMEEFARMEEEQSGQAPEQVPEGAKESIEAGASGAEGVVEQHQL